LTGGEARQDGFEVVSENGKQLFEGDRMGASIAGESGSSRVVSARVVVRYGVGVGLKRNAYVIAMKGTV